VAAVNLSAAVGPFSDPVKATTASDTRISTATFLGFDETTKGNWSTNNIYGSDGFIMLRYFYGRDCQAWPDYLSAADYDGFTNRQLSLWKNATTSTLLTSPISYCARYLGALDTPTSGSIKIYVNDAQPHQLALYACDYNKAGREETIELTDLQGHVLAPACTVSHFELGKWLRFKFSGNLQIRINNQKTGSTAVLSALMFDKIP